MAVVRKGNVLYFAAAGDVETGKVFVTSITCTGDASNPGMFVFKDGAGNTILKVYIGTNLSAAEVTIPVPVNTWLVGLEMDAAPTNGVATAFIR